MKQPNRETSNRRALCIASVTEVEFVPSHSLAVEANSEIRSFVVWDLGGSYILNSREYKSVTFVSTTSF